ncbi:ABC transporter permease [Streptomyces alboflavus]|uniref:ABC transporter permease n=1 Tax=Streptomyces alboflavus TaxID=67267 RepID=A0A1Z1WKS4_9ACTN|nr:ABC transporter permease [Streptomyces alboflavus]
MMLSYALQTIRDRKGGFLGAFVALMCAAALITACGTLLETGLRGTIRTERYAAAPVIVSADQNVHKTTVKHKKGKTKVKHKAKPIAERAWLPDSVTQRLKDVPGVGKVVPELTFLAEPSTPPGARDASRPAYGHAWTSAALTPFRIAAGRAPRADTDLVIDRGLADRAGLEPGDRLTVQSTQAPRTYRVTGIATPGRGDGSGDGALAHQTALFFSTQEAQRLAAHPGKVTAVGVVPADGTSADQLKDAVKKALSGTTAQVSAGDDRGPVEFLDAAGARVRLVSIGGAMGGTSLLVAVLVVVGTFALSIQQRHRELALLRAIAASPKQIRRLLGREALIVGAAGECSARSPESRSAACCTASSCPVARSRRPSTASSAPSRCSPPSPRRSWAPGPPPVSPRAASCGSARAKPSPRPASSPQGRPGPASGQASPSSPEGSSSSSSSAACAPNPPRLPSPSWPLWSSPPPSPCLGRSS